jgi:hypothetical protein
MDGRYRAQLALLGVASLCLSLTRSKPAHASEAEVTATTAAQGYSLRSPWGDPVLSRRRFMQTLGLTVSAIEGEDAKPTDPHYTVRIRLRMDSDFGLNWGEYRAVSTPSSYVPGLSQSPIDLMYGYLDARNLAHGMLSFRLGRQYIIDSLGWWSFDGAWGRVELPVHLAIEAYGGLEQRSGMLLSTPRFERDGVWRGDRVNMDAKYYPEFLAASLAPAFGSNVETLDLPVLHARVGYRKVWNTGSVTTSPLSGSGLTLPQTTSGARVSSERVGASADIDLKELGSLRGGAIYDIYASLFSSFYGSLDAFASKSVTLGIDADRIVPTFDGDSIWNWFVHDPMTTALARADVTWFGKVESSASAGLRSVNVGAESSNTPGGLGRKTDYLGRVHSRYRFDKGQCGISLAGDKGDRGRRAGGDIHAARWVDRDFQLSARVSLYDWKDSFRPDRSATSFGYVLGGAFRAGSDSMVSVEWEHDTNRLVGQRYRVLAMLQVVLK